MASVINILIGVSISLFVLCGILLVWALALRIDVFLLSNALVPSGKLRELSVKLFEANYPGVREVIPLYSAGRPTLLMIVNNTESATGLPKRYKHAIVQVKTLGLWE